MTESIELIEIAATLQRRLFWFGLVELIDSLDPLEKNIATDATGVNYAQML